MSERTIHTPAESQGSAPGRGRLIDRKILVVGAGQTDIGEEDGPIGNGRAIAILCAREGARVAIADRNRESAEATSRLIEDQKAATVIEADVVKERDIERMVKEANVGLGGLDGVVLNVGVGVGDPWLSGITKENWDNTFAINVTSHMLTVKAAFPLLSDGASIVFISSAAGLGAGSQLPAYDSSKSALFGLCRHVAFEGARRWIRANVVAPGLMDTPLGRLATRGRPRRTATHIPLARQGTGWETAYATLFLLSEESAYITGQTLVVDGGLG
jgi:NAD(P)-dependent dehydrogenase (short-subunit alcohol dehydrogenase family)